MKIGKGNEGHKYHLTPSNRSQMKFQKEKSEGAGCQPNSPKFHFRKEILTGKREDFLLEFGTNKQEGEKLGDVWGRFKFLNRNAVWQ